MESAGRLLPRKISTAYFACAISIFYGFRYLLEQNNISVQGKKTLVLGRGGAAKAVKAVLREMGAAEILTVYYKPAVDTISFPS